MKKILLNSICLFIITVAVPNTLLAQYEGQRFNLSGFIETRYQQFEFEQEENNIRIK